MKQWTETDDRAAEIGMALDNLRIYLGWKIDAIRDDSLYDGEDWLQIKIALERDAEEIGELIDNHACILDRGEEEEA